MANSDNEIPISLTVDTSALTALEDAASSVPDTIDIDINATENFSDLSFDEIPEETNTDVNVTETEDAKTAIADIHFLALKEKIETVWNIIGTGIDFITSVGDKFVSPFLDVEDAVARINAQTGGTGIADVGQFIRDIQAADLGDSTEQIADVVIKAKQLGLPIQAATESALLFTHTWKDEDPSTIVGAWGTALQTGIVDNMQEASDLMTIFFQQGGNIGGDAVQVVQDNAQTWADMGLNMSQALSIMDSLQQGTGASATDAAKMMQTFDDALTTAAADPASQQAKLLTMMGIDNPKEQGKAIGAETFDGFAEAFSTLSSEQQDQISGLFFGKGGKKFTGAIGAITSEADPYKEAKDAAAAAATEIDNSLRGAIDDFVLLVNTKITELLSSESIDLPGKIKAIKEGFQEAVEVLANGGTVGEAIEVGLNMPGFADSVTRFEASVGNFVISVLEIIAGIQDFLGKDSSGTRRQIEQAERRQLPFNLKVANADEIAGELQTAVDRGVSTADIKKGIGTAVNELINSGDLDKAQVLVDSIKTLPSEELQVAPNLDVIKTAAANQSLASGDTKFAEEQGWLIHVPVEVDTSDLQAKIDKAKAQADALAAQAKLKFGPDEAKPNPLGAFGAEQGAAQTSPFLTGLDEIETKATGVFSTATKAFEDVLTSANDNLGGAGVAAAALADDMETSDQRIATAATGNTITASFEAIKTSADNSFPIVLQWFDTTAQGAAELDAKVTGSIGHMSKMLHDLQFLSAQVAQGVKDALQAGANLPGLGAGGGGSTTNNTTVNQTNNNQNNAQTAATTYQIAAALGG